MPCSQTICYTLTIYHLLETWFYNLKSNRVAVDSICRMCGHPEQIKGIEVDFSVAILQVSAYSKILYNHTIKVLVEFTLWLVDYPSLLGCYL